MSVQNVELHRRLLEAFNTRDIEAFIAGCDPSVEYHSVMTGPFGTVYHGRDVRVLPSMPIEEGMKDVQEGTSLF